MILSHGLMIVNTGSGSDIHCNVFLYPSMILERQRLSRSLVILNTGSAIHGGVFQSSCKTQMILERWSLSHGLVIVNIGSAKHGGVFLFSCKTQMILER